MRMEDTIAMAIVVGVVTPLLFVLALFRAASLEAKSQLTTRPAPAVAQPQRRHTPGNRGLPRAA